MPRRPWRPNRLPNWPAPPSADMIATRSGRPASYPLGLWPCSTTLPGLPPSPEWKAGAAPNRRSYATSFSPGAGRPTGCFRSFERIGVSRTRCIGRSMLPSTKIWPATARIMGRQTSPSCDDWRSTSPLPIPTPRLRCAENSCAPDGTTASSSISSAICDSPEKWGREAMADRKTIDPGLVAKIVGSYVKHNEIPPGELPNLIAVVHRSLTELGKPAEVTMVPTPAVALNRSYGRTFVVCLECGWRGLTLRRHLAVSHGQAPAEYRARWRLKATHPLTAPAYSERRSTLA